MNKKLKQSLDLGFERVTLVALSGVFIFVMFGAWNYAMNLRQTVAANAAGVDVDQSPILEIEHLRNVADAQIADARSYFLLGSKTLSEKQQAEKLQFNTDLAAFEKKYSLPELPEITKRIAALVQQQQEIFDQATEFRDKQTESKIVGQFYQSKTIAIRNGINEALDEIIRLHNAELGRARTKAHEAGLAAEALIPKGMTIFIEILSCLFLGMALLVMRMLRKHGIQNAERDRLVIEAKNAVLARDEIVSAVSRDLKEPLNAITEIAEGMITSPNAGDITDRAELIKSSITEIEGFINDISDQKKFELGNLSLRVDQLAMDELLDEAMLMLKAQAKQRDVRLQFEPVNPPVSAFADRDRVLRVLTNLVGNAIKFSPKHSRVVVKVRSDQQFVNIAVTDSGPGIPEKHLPEIFNEFWQARKTSNQGAGIGLVVVKTLVEAQGGTVKVDSLVGHGTTFTFSLPRRRPVGTPLKKPASTVRLANRPATATSSENTEAPQPTA
jgi:signal transduction histidine kinase